MSETSQEDRPQAPGGIGGWLALLVFLLLLIGPMMRIFMAAAELENLELDFRTDIGEAQWGRLVSIIWYHAAAGATTSALAALFLMARKKRSTVFVVVALIWLGGPGVNASEILNLRSIGLPSGPDYVAGAIAIGVIALFWTLYLLLSRRVRNTYPKA